MTNALLTPLDFSAPEKAGRRRFWKQILPITKINYKGQKVNFDPKFHMDLATAFKSKAYDQVPIVFADGENRHNMDPRNYGGEVLDMAFRKGKGTFALIEADRAAAKAIKRNPRLGVSARIVQGLEKSDGRQFPRAVNHVLLTMNPRVSGMEPWQAVDLSDEDAEIEVVDLTAAHYKEGTEMGKTATKRRQSKSTSARQIDLSALDDEQFEQLLDLAQAALAEREDEDVDEDVDEDTDENEVEDPSPIRRKVRRKKSKTKVTIEKDSEDDGDPEDDDEDPDAETDEDEDETDLSDTDHVLKRGEVSQFQQMRYDLAAEKWDKERDSYLRAGVPPFLLDLAEPVLSLPDAMTLDLSEDEELDATETIRQMLDGVKGIVDLTDEIGHQMDLSEDEDTRDEADKFLDEWDKQYG